MRVTGSASQRAMREFFASQREALPQARKET